MSEPPSQPTLTPQFCFHQTALRDFLRTSRSMIDDSIIQNLNALMTPSTVPWDPSSTAERQIRPLDRRPTDPNACRLFKDGVLFPSWQSRSDVLTYCAGVANDPMLDPDRQVKLSKRVEEEKESLSAMEAGVVASKERERENERILFVDVVDDRMDPYSARTLPREPRTEVLASLIRNERRVEGIIRSRTWGLVAERCGNEGMDWEGALDQWRAKRGRP